MDFLQPWVLLFRVNTYVLLKFQYFNTDLSQKRAFVVEILEKMEGSHLKKWLTNQLTIKEVGELAELDDIESTTKSKGGLKVNKHVPKYTLIKTHTARRSFCTNAYLAGVPVIDIMAISTHTTESSFMKYIKVTKEQQANRMAQHPFFKSQLI